MTRSADVVIGATLDGSFDNALSTAEERIGNLGKTGTGAAIGDMNRYTTAINSQIEATKNQRAAMRSGLLDMVALGASLRGIVNPAMKFESSMADVAKIVYDGTAESEAAIDRLGESIRDMTSYMPMTHSELAEITAAGARMGVALQDLPSYTEMIAKMAVAWEMSAEAAGLAIAKIGNLAGLDMTGMSELGDMINKLDDTSTAKAPEIIEMLQRTVDAGMKLGMTTGEIAALNTTMLDLGAGSMRGSTALLDMFNTLSNAPNLTDEAVAAFGTLGLDPEQFQMVMLEDGIEGIRQFQEAMEGLDAATRKRVMTDIFGTGLQTANIDKLLSGFETLERHLATISEGGYVDSVLKEFERRTATSENSLKLMGNAVRDLSIALGGSLLGAINDSSAAINKLLGTITEFVDAHPQATKAIMGTAAALIAFRIATFAGGYGLTFMKEGVLQLAKAATVTGATLTGQNWAAIGAKLAPVATNFTAVGAAVKGLGVALMTTPIGWVAIGVVAALTTAALAIRKYWEPLSAFFTGVWDGLKGTFDEMKGAVDGALAPFKEALAPLEPLFTSVGEALGSVVTWFKELLNPVELTDEAFGEIYESGMAFGEMLGGALTAAINTALAPVRLLGEAFNLASTGIQNALQYIEDLGFTFEGVEAMVGQFVDNALDKLANFGADLWATVQPGLLEFWNMLDSIFGVQSLFDAGRNLITGLWNGMKSVMNEVVGWLADKIAGLTDFMPDWVKDALGIEAGPRVLSAQEIEEEARKAADDAAGDMPKYREGQSRALHERDAEAMYPDDETGLFGRSMASDAVQAQRDAYVESKVAAEVAAQIAAVERVRTQAFEAAVAELEAQNAELMAKRRAELGASMDPLGPMTGVPTASPPALMNPPAAGPVAPMQPIPVVLAQPPAQAPEADGGGGDQTTASTYQRGAEIVKAAMAEAVALESARAAALAAEKPRSITANVQAPITVNNYGSPDAGGAAVAAGVKSGVDGALAGERDLYAD
jgi:TP901 family phage tail tape measure protein